MHEDEPDGISTDIIYRHSFQNIENIVQSNENTSASDEIQKLFGDLVKNYEKKTTNSISYSNNL